MLFIGNCGAPPFAHGPHGLCILEEESTTSKGGIFVIFKAGVENNAKDAGKEKLKWNTRGNILLAKRLCSLRRRQTKPMGFLNGKESSKLKIQWTPHFALRRDKLNVIYYMNHALV